LKDFGSLTVASLLERLTGNPSQVKSRTFVNDRANQNKLALAPSGPSGIAEKRRVDGAVAREKSQGLLSGEEVRPMKTITIEVPDEMTSLGGGTDEQLAGAMRLATAILWYRQGRISQGKAAEIAGMNRVLFLNALYEAKVEAIQVTEEELKREMELPRSADR